MLTIDLLIARATEAEASGDHRTSHLAFAAARWMEEGGLTEVRQIGDFGGQKIAKGQRVRIRKGTIIRTTNPRYSRDNPKVAGRDYVVTAFDTYSGHIQSHWHPHDHRHAVRNSEVVWPGEGGYWCYVDTSEVEVLA